MRAIFVAGTNTGVGKTYVAAALVRSFCEMGLRVHVMKPIESGLPLKKGEVPQDTAVLVSANRRFTPTDRANIYYYPMPVSPWTACRIDDSLPEPDFTKIKQELSKLGAEADIVVVEGVGGIASPITSSSDNLTLAKFLDIPVVLVALNRLGVLSETKLAVYYIRSQGHPLLGVILNDGPGTYDSSDVSVATNPEEVSQWAGVPLLFHFKTNHDTRQVRELAEKLLHLIL